MIVKSLRKDVNMVFDAHLMIENQDNYIKEFADAGCDIIVVHQEACTHLHRTIQNIKSHGIKAGVALNPATPIETIKYVLQDVDMVLLMSVNPAVRHADECVTAKNGTVAATALAHDKTAHGQRQNRIRPSVKSRRKPVNKVLDDVFAAETRLAFHRVHAFDR